MRAESTHQNARIVRDAVRPEPGTARQRNEFAFRGTRRRRLCEWPKVIHTHEIDVTGAPARSNNNGVDVDCVDNSAPQRDA
jgi:hypothetical protein